MSVSEFGGKTCQGWKQGRGITQAAQAQRGSLGIPLLEPKGILYTAGGLPPSLRIFGKETHPFVRRLNPNAGIC